MLFFPTFSTEATAGALVGALCAYAVGWVVYTFYYHPLSHVPGPRLAALTGWWYTLSIRLPIIKNISSPLHDEYGLVVRIQPDTVSISDPRAIDVVLGTKPQFTKGQFAASFDPHIKDGRELFSLVDHKAHADLRRTVGPLWSPGAIAEYEGRIDRILDAVKVRFARASESGILINIPKLLASYVQDIMGEIFYGKIDGFGCVSGDDIDPTGWKAMMQNVIPALAAMGVAPPGTQTLYMLSQLLISPRILHGLRSHSKLIEDAQALVAERVNESESTTATRSRQGGENIVSKMLAMAASEQKAGRAPLTHGDIACSVYDSIMAGYETTMTTISHLLHDILIRPEIYTKLTTEIQTAFANKSLSNPPTQPECLKLPYLSACIKESGRFSPPGTVGIVRRVPPNTTSKLPDGTQLPGGTTVILNGNCTSHDTRIYGSDPHTFRPARWLVDPNDPKSNTAEQIALMEKYSLQFGAGPRSCLGKHLAYMELYKFLPAVLKDFELQVQGTPSVTWNGMIKVNNFYVRVTQRQG
jgi:cytochrome P450